MLFVTAGSDGVFSDESGMVGPTSETARLQQLTTFLVFTIVHINILVSGVFSFLSSFFFTAQHSEPYVIAGLMIILKTLSFNEEPCNIRHQWQHLTHQVITTRLVTHLPIAHYPGYLLQLHPPSLVNSDPRYVR